MQKIPLSKLKRLEPIGSNLLINALMQVCQTLDLAKSALSLNLDLAKVRTLNLVLAGIEMFMSGLSLKGWV